MLLERAVKMVMERKGYYISPTISIIIKADKASLTAVAAEAQRRGQEHNSWVTCKRRKGTDEVVGYVHVSPAAVAKDGKEYFVINEIGCCMDIKLAEFCDMIESIGHVIVAEDGHKGLIEVAAA